MAVRIQVYSVEKQTLLEEIPTTTGYLLFYFDGDRIKTKGDIELRALAPFLAKYLVNKLAGTGL